MGMCMSLCAHVHVSRMCNASVVACVCVCICVPFSLCYVLCAMSFSSSFCSCYCLLQMFAFHLLGGLLLDCAMCMVFVFLDSFTPFCTPYPGTGYPVGTGNQISQT